MSLRSRLLAEALGSAFLLAVVVGSGIMGERLSDGNIAIALLANAVATGCALFALIQMFGPISGAHFNPAVSLAMLARGKLAARDAAGYITAQVVGAFSGVASAHAMFGLPAFSASTHPRLGAALVWSEFVATFGLLLVILLASRKGLMATALSVASYIVAAYWFTASTSFANPAVSLARASTDTFSGIRADGVPWFIVAQLIAILAAVGTEKVLLHPQEN
jgi:glycerol uptake facilitator-like aquaporin